LRQAPASEDDAKRLVPTPADTQDPQHGGKPPKRRRRKKGKADQADPVDDELDEAVAAAAAEREALLCAALREWGRWPSHCPRDHVLVPPVIDSSVRCSCCDGDHPVVQRCECCECDFVVCMECQAANASEDMEHSPT